MRGLLARLLLFPLGARAEPREALCSARLAAGDPLPLERRFIGMLIGGGCQAGDLLHLVFEGPGAAAAAARHCRFDAPVLMHAGPETHLVCIWTGEMRAPRG